MIQPPNKRNNANNLQFFLLTGIVSISFIFLTYKLGSFFRSTAKEVEDDVLDGTNLEEEEEAEAPERIETPTAKETIPEATTPIITNTANRVVPEHVDIPKLDVLKDSYTFADLEEWDKKGKGLFRQNNFLEAAECFTKALEVGAALRGEEKKNLTKHEKTLLNNRAAMYEKQANALDKEDDAVSRLTYLELALSDVDTLLEEDLSYTKARQRKLRLYEMAGRFKEAMTEVCAMQLLFMQEHRDTLRMGIPLPSNVKPPVSQEKIEELMAKILPAELEQFAKDKEAKKKNKKSVGGSLASEHTIVQLLKSFRSYNRWMADAAKYDSISSLTSKLDKLLQEENSDNVIDTLEQVDVIFRRGSKYAYERNFASAVSDFENAYSIVQTLTVNEGSKAVVESDEVYPRLLEWVGFCKHLQYDLDAASEIYQLCIELDPANTEVLVKRAGVLMDSGDGEGALVLFDSALLMEPDATDALFHRANCYTMQGKMANAQTDLEQCVKLKPDFTMARLRLATIYMISNSVDKAMKCIEEAEKYDPKSADVRSHKGELKFNQGDIQSAKEEFEKAIQYDPNNPNAYVNLSMIVLNIPGPNGMPDVQEALRLLEKSIELDPQFFTAYVQYGQLRLSLATNLVDAQEVVKLYDRGLEQCRTPEEAKELCSMRVLAVSQIDAAGELKLETLNMSPQ